MLARSMKLWAVFGNTMSSASEIETRPSDPRHVTSTVKEKKVGGIRLRKKKNIPKPKEKLSKTKH